MGHQAPFQSPVLFPANSPPPLHPTCEPNLLYGWLHVNVALISNSRSGRGHAHKAAVTLERELTRAGYAPAFAPAASPEADRLLRESDVVILIGGDGTLHHALPELIAHNTPLYHVAFGTENLFARSRGMTRRVRDIIASLNQPEFERVDVVYCEHPFHRHLAIMLGIGPDAGVIHRLTAKRRGSISRLSYTGPIIREAMNPTLPRLSINVDGHDFVTDRRGLAIIANGREYAARLNPVSCADDRDGMMDILFVEARATARLVTLAAASWVRQNRRLPFVRLARARSVTIINHDGADAPMQMDGEAAGMLGAQPLTLRVLPEALRVIIPANRRLNAGIAR
jgi:diacylglycerol kinase (ATP)